MNSNIHVQYREGSKKAVPKDTSLAGRLKAVRKSENLSQKQFGESLGIPWRTYQNYELSLRVPSAELVAAVIAEFDLDSDWLLFGDEGRPTSSRKGADE